MGYICYGMLFAVTGHGNDRQSCAMAISLYLYVKRPLPHADSLTIFTIIILN